jgi:hypothetical protein
MCKTIRQKCLSSNLTGVHKMSNIRARVRLQLTAGVEEWSHQKYLTMSQRLYMDS